jgi:hypothetical protein
MSTVPLLVHVVYHPASQDAADLALHLHAHLNDDPAIPGLRIPTLFVPDDKTGAPPAEEVLPAEADRVVVVVLADDYLVANAWESYPNGRRWCDYVVSLSEACAESQRHLFFPVQLSDAAWPVDPRLSGLNFLRASCIDDKAQRESFVARRLVHALCRHLGADQAAEDTPPVTIFVSHTKLDLDIEPKVVRSLLSELTATQPTKTWFDSGEIETGSQFAHAIERGVSDAALIAVLTDSYASRAWCRREILLAKRYQRPVIVIDALREREVRSFPYVGNVPVLRWRGDPQEAIGALLKETLRHLHARTVLAARKRPDDDILPTGPELVTLTGKSRSRTILYPDPPLGLEEIDVLASTGLRIETPLERFAKETMATPLSQPIALSVSEPEDLARWGLRKAHLETIYLEISRYLLLSGARLAYGGHLQSGSYTLHLFDLLSDPLVERLRTQRADVESVDRPRQLVSYIGWPIPFTIKDKARFAMLVDTKRIPRPPGVDEALDPSLVEDPPSSIELTSPAGRYAWARGMTAMREQQSRDTAVRIAVGGKLGPGVPGRPDDWYKSRIPGVLEEIWLSLESERPVYLVGAFGGCTRAVLDAIEGRDRPELSWECQKHAPHAEGMRALYQQRGEAWLDYAEIVSGLRKRGLAGLANGLTAAENRELGATRSAERIIELILEGLRRRPSASPLAR